MSSALSLIKMPSESSFKRQADIASDALKTFSAVQSSKSSMVVKAAVIELIDATIAFNEYLPFFLAHPLFQEIPPAVFNTLEQFGNKNPKFEMPSTIARVAGLDARVKDSLRIGKQGKISFSLSTIFFLTTSDSVPVGPRADRVVGIVRKAKTSSVSPLLFFLLIMHIVIFFRENAPDFLKKLSRPLKKKTNSLLR